MFQILSLFSWLHAGPATPGPFSVSVERQASLAGLNVSWQPEIQSCGAVVYLVTSSQGLQCNSTNASCILAPVGCGETHNIHMVAENEAGPSYPTDPVAFLTCESQHCSDLLAASHMQLRMTCYEYIFSQYIGQHILL